MKHREASVLSGALTCRQKRSVIEVDVSLDMWLGEYMEAVQVQFGPRVWFIGLQGSFGRGEATAGERPGCGAHFGRGVSGRSPGLQRHAGPVAGTGTGYAGLCQEKGSSWPGSLRTSFNFAMIPGPSWGPWIRCWRKSRRGTSTGRSGQGLQCVPHVRPQYGP